MNRRTCALILSLVLSGLSSPARAAADDHPDIRAVIESFRTAIIERDRSRFLALFIKPDVPWQSVFADQSVAKLKLKNPAASKAAFDADNNPLGFIDWIVKDPASHEETFSNIRIDADSDVASVAFDYTFLLGGKKTNWGQESWLLVRTEAGWKITTLAYSIILP